MLYAAGILLFITLCLSAYWVGVRRGTDVAKSTPPPQANQAQVATENPASLEEQLSDAAHEREIARGQVAARDKSLADLRRQLQRQSAEIGRLKEAQDRLESELIEADAPKGHWEALSLFLYNPKSAQWSQTFLNSKMA